VDDLGLLVDIFRCVFLDCDDGVLPLDVVDVALLSLPVVRGC